MQRVQGELGAELSVVLGVLRLQPPVPASERDSTEWELELRGLALAASTYARRSARSLLFLFQHARSVRSVPSGVVRWKLSRCS